MLGRHEVAPVAVHDRTDEMTVLDVRDHHEWQEGHVLGTTHLPLAIRVAGGMVAWERHGRPIATETGRPGRVA